jgi:hypothetical protein
MEEVGVGTQWFPEKEKEGSASEGINTCFFLSLFHSFLFLLQPAI